MVDMCTWLLATQAARSGMGCCAIHQGPPHRQRALTCRRSRTSLSSWAKLASHSTAGVQLRCGAADCARSQAQALLKGQLLASQWLPQQLDHQKHHATK